MAEGQIKFSLFIIAFICFIPLFMLLNKWYLHFQAFQNLYFHTWQEPPTFIWLRCKSKFSPAYVAVGWFVVFTYISSVSVSFFFKSLVSLNFRIRKLCGYSNISSFCFTLLSSLSLFFPLLSHLLFLSPCCGIFTEISFQDTSANEF